MAHERHLPAVTRNTGDNKVGTGAGCGEVITDEHYMRLMVVECGGTEAERKVIRNGGDLTRKCEENELHMKV